MKKQVAEVLAEYDARLTREDLIVDALSQEEYDTQRDEFLLGIGAATGDFLNLLIKTAKPRLVVEVGSSYGYSTLWLAEAVQAIGGRMMSFELSSTKVEFADKHLREAGLRDVVQFVQGDVLETMKSFAEPVDFVLIDLWKELYIPVLDLVYPTLTNGALVAADNVLLPAIHAAKLQAYVSHVRSLPGMQSVTVPVGRGVELSRFSLAIDEHKDTSQTCRDSI